MGSFQPSGLRCTLTFAALFLAGCSPGLREIDARTQKLVDDRSRALGAPAPAPRSHPEPRQIESSEQWTKRPGTVNPASEDLPYRTTPVYRPEEEADRIAERLESYQISINPPPGTEILSLALNAAFQIAQKSAREYLNAEEEYIFAAIRLLIERHLWGPRFFNDTTLQIAGAADSGDVRSALTIINELRVTQRLPYGGSAEAAFITRATDQLRETASGGYRQSSELVLSAGIPLLRGAGLVAQEALIQAERNLIYAARDFEAFRRNFLVEVARDYFNLLEFEASIRNQEAQVSLLETIYRGEVRRFEAGRIAAFRRDIAANDLLRATASLAGLRESFILQLERFKLRLGINPQIPVQLSTDVLQLPEPDISLDDAVQLALSYRLDLQNRRDDLDDFRRDVAAARNQLLPNLDLRGNVGIPTDPDDPTGGIALSPQDFDYSASVTLGLPLDREIERLRLRQAVIQYEQRARAYELFRDQVVIAVRQAVRNIDLARFQLNLAERQVVINESRNREIELKQDQVDTQAKVDAVNALQQARNARDRALTDLRVAILNYLRDSGQIRVARDGSFQPLPGMEPRPAIGPEPFPGPDPDHAPVPIDEPAPPISPA
jgi:outer membrane protein TolC